MGNVLVKKGHVVDLFDVRKIPSSVVPQDYDGVLVGASVHAGGYQRRLKKWVKFVFAGALAYSKYNFLVKWWMKRIAKKSGGETDTSKDYEYTNWNDVSRFAEDFSNKILGNLSRKESQTRDLRKIVIAP
jgi:menaquinone-dependent protoporphyrinogen IX oxidase